MQCNMFVRLLVCAGVAVVNTGCLVTYTVQAWALPEVHVIGSEVDVPPRLLVNIKNVGGIEDGEYVLQVCRASQFGDEAEDTANRSTRVLSPESRRGGVVFPYPMMTPWHHAESLSSEDVTCPIDDLTMASLFGTTDAAEWVGYQVERSNDDFRLTVYVVASPDHRWAPSGQYLIGPGRQSSARKLVAVASLPVTLLFDTILFPILLVGFVIHG